MRVNVHACERECLLLQLFVTSGGGVVDASNAGKVFKKTWRLALPDSPVPAGLTASGVRYGAVISTATSEPCHQE